MKIKVKFWCRPVVHHPPNHVHRFLCVNPLAILGGIHVGLEPILFGDERDKEPTTHDFLNSGTFVAMRCTRETPSSIRVTVRIYEYQLFQVTWRVEREVVIREDESVPLGSSSFSMNALVFGTGR